MKNHSNDEKKEITKTEFLQRRLAKEANVDYKKIALRQIDETDWAKLTRAAGTIEENLQQLVKVYKKRLNEIQDQIAKKKL